MEQISDLEDRVDAIQQWTLQKLWSFKKEQEQFQSAMQAKYSALEKQYSNLEEKYNALQKQLVAKDRTSASHEGGNEQKEIKNSNEKDSKVPYNVHSQSARKRKAESLVPIDIEDMDEEAQKFVAPFEKGFVYHAKNELLTRGQSLFLRAWYQEEKKKTGNVTDRKRVV